MGSVDCPISRNSRKKRSKDSLFFLNMQTFFEQPSRHVIMLQSGDCDNIE